ncbi:zinc-ribbon domain-containing protein [Roseobacter sinensis]|uniref:Zinc-ribbon domain-containing protein n=1 Tax=Roseobacter sinensis TaxID=2931391 RepID=A0ABT3BGE1_9RHOB|nr:zinc-ribbon domain-containing protein [Roseobacter sp. WL0113]MCV3272174.1 zinc-ribbon domain-containing protein [Roseobacter sp. WL0113]
MRLICPNCDAQYEVPDDVMPPEGRDVQCSNCGQTWFQVHPDTQQSEPSEAVEQGSETVKAAEEGPADTEEVEGETAAAPEDDGAPEPDDDTEDTDTDAEVEAAPRRELDPAVVDVLREEAELEKKARQNEIAGSVESQPDLGLDENSGNDETRRRARETLDRKAKARGEKAALPVAEATAVSGASGDMLPDIQEINSTLRSNNDRSAADDPGQTAQIETRERRSFGRGFVTTLLLVAILALVYVFAPQVAETLPQADPWLSAYVGLVDGWRVWLDGQVKDVLVWLDATTTSGGQ